MIFISYNHKDKEVVKEVCIRIAKSVGKENIFFDEWSIRPGDGIIDKMNQGLNDSNVFFFFVSRNSLLSKMVKLEWQNALMKKTQNNDFLFVPVRIDNSIMPPILLQVLYIDLFSKGLEFAIRQMIDTINNQNTDSLEPKKFSNLYATRKTSADGLTETITLHAKYYFEPTSQFVFFTQYKKDDLIIGPGACKTDGMYFSSGVIPAPLAGFNCFNLKVNRGLTPDNPIAFEIKVKERNKGTIVFGVFHMRGPRKLENIELTDA